MTADAPGVGIVRAAWYGTAGFTVTALAATVVGGTVRGFATAVDLALFVVGCVGFGSGFLAAVRRSRREEISVAGVFFLVGDVAPRDVRRSLRWALLVEVVAAVATAAARPYSALAFGVLVPVYGLALTGMWAARHGAFPPRRPPSRRFRRSPNDG